METCKYCEKETSKKITESLEILAFVAVQYMDWEKQRRGSTGSRLLVPESISKILKNKY